MVANETRLTIKRNRTLKTIIKIAWMPLLWAALCAVFYWDALKAPASAILGGNDLNTMFRIWLDYARSRISSGQLPIWNPYLFSGYAFISDPQPALFYPPTWLSLLFPPNQGLSWSLVLHIWWSAVGCSLWLRSMTDQHNRPISWAGALAGAAVFSFSGYTFARIQAGHIGVITTGAWLPWGLLALNSLAQNLKWRFVGYGALSIGFALLAGHTATFIYLVIMLLAYALFLAWNLRGKSRIQYLMMAAIMGFLGLLLAGIQLLPTLKLILGSSRLGTSDYAFASRFSWPVGYLLTLLVPNFFGEPVRTGYWGDGAYEEMIFYVGLLPLMLMWVAGRMRSKSTMRSHVVFWLGTGGLALLTAFGSNGIIHLLLYRFVPFFSSMRAPGRAGILFTCSACALTAYTIHELSQANAEDRQQLIEPVSPSLITVVLAITVITVICAFSLFAWGRDSNPEAGRFWHLANEIAVFGLFFGLTSSWVRRWLKSPITHWLPITALILILLDLWTLGSGLVKVVPAPLSNYWESVAQSTGNEAGRILPWGLSIFEQNGALSYRIRSVFGYNPLEDDSYNRFITFNPDPRAKIYDLLNVTHVSTTVPLTLEDDDTLKLVTENGGVYIYKRATALPEAWMTDTIERISGDTIITRINTLDFDPLHTTLVDPDVICPNGDGGTVTIQASDSPESLIAHVESKGGIVVFSERYAQGWNATFDGDDVPVIKANGILRAVCAPPGEYDIQLRYQPQSPIWGSVLSTLSVIVISFLIILPRRYNNSSL